MMKEMSVSEAQDMLMMDIGWEGVFCHVCGGGDVEPLIVKGKELVDGQFGFAVHPVICRCGFVFLSPRWSKGDYDKFYRYYYDPLYRLEIKPDYGVEGVVKNMRVIWERIKGFVPGGIEAILDIGCGSGYGLRYLREENPGSKIYGIESSPQCMETLRGEEVGAVLVTDDAESDWVSEYESSFDLVIMRHVIEHILEPVEAMRRTASVLKPGGLIYIATPDMMHPRVELRDYKHWWEYWFRAVHPYYYCKENLFKTLEKSGLYPVAFGEKEKEEVWCLVGKEPKAQVSLDGLYERQMGVLRKYLP